MIAATKIYEFEEFRVDAIQRRVTRAGEAVALHSKAFDLLLVLVHSAGRDVSKDELLEAVWPGQILEESNLAVNISAIRRALGETAAQARFIVTIPGHGYRFVANVREAPGQMVGLVIERETFARVRVEQEPDKLRTHAPELIVNQTSPVARTRRGSIILAVLGVLVVSAAGLAWWRNAPAKNSLGRFQQISYRQLTNNGIVYNAALSPDGKFFAFVMIQKEKETLRAGQTNSTEQIELRPPDEVSYEGLRFSQDGSSLFYSFAAHKSLKFDLYKIPALGGVPVKLRENVGNFFALSQDDKRVAFVREEVEKGTSSIVIANLDGSNESAIVTLPAARTIGRRGLAWSPDGSRLAFAAGNGNGDSLHALYVADLATGAITTLPAPHWRSIDSVVWLRDRSGLAVTAQGSNQHDTNQLWFVALPGGEVSSITRDLTTYDVGLGISDDSRNFLLVRLQQLNHIWVMPADDPAKTRQITFGTIGSNDGLLGLDWTPLNQIVYGSSTGRGQSIWTIDPDGRNAKQITAPEYGDAMPNISAEGRTMVFESNRSGGTEIWRANLDGSDARQLTNCGKNFQPNISPDSKWVVYKSTCDGVGSLWRVPFEGGPSQRLTEKAFSWPSISPDGKWIACGFATPVKYLLAIIPIEGGEPAKFFDSAPLANIRLGIRWAGDGKSVIYRDQRVGLWRQTLDGGAPARIPGLPPEKIYGFGWSRDNKLLAYTLGTEIRDVVLITSAN